MTVTDDERVLTACDWHQIHNGRWTHPRYTSGSRCRSYTLEQALDIERDRVGQQIDELTATAAVIATVDQ